MSSNRKYERCCSGVVWALVMEEEGPLALQMTCLLGHCREEDSTRGRNGKRSSFMHGWIGGEGG
jgi:hypothetical protein